MPLKLLTFACLFLITSMAVAQTDEKLTQRIDSIFNRWDKTNSPGCALAVVKDGKIIYKRGYGMSNLEYNLAITPGSLFHVASISKQFTAAAIQRLAIEGKLSLHDDVRKYIPEMPDFGHTITIANLIHHTSGLRDQWDLQGLAGWRDDDVITEADVMDMLKRQQALNFVPGEEYVYCNTGFTLLGVIVKRVTGVSLRNYADSVFFKPLGMNSTVFHSDHTEIVVNRTSAYEKQHDGRWAISIPVFDNYGATSLFTTVEDLAKWDENFYSKQVGGEAFIRAMLEPGVLNNGTIQTYASGLAIGDYKGNKTVEHSGADAGYRADILRFPDRHLSVIVLANLANINPSDLCRKVANLFLPGRGGDLTMITVADKEAVRGDAGDYFDPVTKGMIELKYNDGSLVQNGMTLGVENDSVFKLPNGSTYTFRQGGGNPSFVVRSAGMKDRVYEHVTKVVPTRAELAEYAGVFHSRELAADFVIAVKDSVLTVKTPRNEAMELQPFIKDVFTGNFVVEFVRDKRKRVTGFLLSTGRSRNLVFTKSSGLTWR
jgi:CubicO group peptidase (beta-lactamase class C family)